MYYLIEDPTLFILLGIVLEAGLGIALFRTGRGVFLWIMLGVLAVCLTGIIGQRFIITDHKRVVQTLDGVAAALEDNDVDKVFSYLMNENQFSRNQARMALGMVRVESATYSQLKVEINTHPSPWIATVTFTGVIKSIDPRSNSPHPPFLRKFTLTMRKQGDRWLIEKHQIGDGKEGQPF
jgi:hypothetical protein